MQAVRGSVMPVTNAFLAEWRGEYQWTVPGLPIDLYAFAEDNVSRIPALEGWHIAGYRAGGRTVALLSCRVPRPASIPGRPGVVYPHVLIGDERTDPAALQRALRSSYPEPVDFARRLSARMADGAGATPTAAGAIEAVRPLLDAVAVHSVATSPAEPVPPSPDSPVLKLLRANTVLMVALIGLGIYQSLLLRQIAAAKEPGTATHPVAVDQQPRNSANSDTPAITPAAPPAGAEPDEVERALQAGNVFVLDSLPSGTAFISNDRSVALTQAIRRYLGSHPDERVLVDVYTDMDGETSANLQTSQFRARLLQAAIVTGLGEEASRLIVTGRGEAATPTTPGKTPVTSRARRIVVTASPLS